MGTFFGSLIGFCFLTYLLIMLCGAVFGEAGLYIGCFLAVGVIFALVVCLLEKLETIGEKLDKLLEEKERES